MWLRCFHPHRTWYLFCMCAHPQFNTYVASGVLLQNYAHVFDLLIRLRQAVDHPYLVVHSQTAQSGCCLSYGHVLIGMEWV